MASELARITAHYLAVIMERSNMSASIADMRAEIDAAAEADASDVEALADRVEVLERVREHEERLRQERRS